MQPNAPSISPPPTPTPSSTPPVDPNSQPQPDYSFLTEQHKKSFNLPFVGNSLVGRLAVVVVGLLVLVILFIIIKGLIVGPPFSKPDYYLLTERQQEMLHILSADITLSNSTQLSVAQQNFISTATLSLQTAQTATLSYMSAYKYKVNTKVLDNIYSASVDQQFVNAASANNFSGFFQSEMTTQLSDYTQELKAAYNSSHESGGRILIKSEYSEANLLLRALNSTTS